MGGGAYSWEPSILNFGHLERCLFEGGSYLRGGDNSKFKGISILQFADSCGFTSSLAREHSSLFGVEQD